MKNAANRRCRAFRGLHVYDLVVLGGQASGGNGSKRFRNRLAACKCRGDQAGVGPLHRKPVNQHFRSGLPGRLQLHPCATLGTVLFMPGASGYHERASVARPSKTTVSNVKRSYNDSARRNGSGLCREATLPRDSLAGSSKRRSAAPEPGSCLIGSKDANALRIPARRAEYSLMESASSPF